VIEPADVALVSVRLPAEIEATVFGDGDGNEVVGSLVLEAIHAGELLTRGDIGSRRSTAGRDAGYAVAVELDRPGALNGLIAAGERVDVVVTDRSISHDAGLDTPGLVAAGALVLDVDDLSSPEQPADTVTVTLQVRERAAAISVATAADAGAITLIRPWRASPQAVS
jgi:Flp pilus assembly protein CpaB